jgi:antitoxin (DNA-binding transcriptional repressor) of toxin-antitoxin stability system
MKTTVDSYQAKTNLPELLRQVQLGKSFTITNRGDAIADLVPSAKLPRDKRESVEKMKAFKNNLGQTTDIFESTVFNSQPKLKRGRVAIIFSAH